MTLDTTRMDTDKIHEKVIAAGQEHVFDFWETLPEAGRQKLLAQLDKIDFELLARLKETHLSGSEAAAADAKLEPADFIHLPQTPEELAAVQSAKEAGEEALRRGRVAAFLVAGGQGSRLGYDGPKGVFKITPVKQKSFFQLHAEKLLAISRKYDAPVPWFIMTSLTNHDETVAFFEQNNYFGLRKSDVTFMPQQMVPALDKNGKVLLDAKDHVFENPTGHGGSLLTLKKSGALDDMKKRGIDLIFYFQVDNVLLNMCDPVFLGFHLQEKSEMSAKICVKSGPDEKVGVLGLIDGKLGVIEYSDLSSEQKNAKNPDGSLKFQAGNIAIHILNIDFVEQQNEGGLRLPWHVAHKQISHLDASGKLVTPEKPNGYKFETFVFDALGAAKQSMFLEVVREDEFSPVKNPDGIDSVVTAQRDMQLQAARWLEAAGVRAPRNGDNLPKHKLEISPLFALDKEELKTKVDANLKIGGDFYLG